MQLFTQFAISSSEIGVDSSTVNIILAVSTLLVIALPLFFVIRSQNKSRNVTLN